MEQKMSSDSPYLVIGIDFGTTYSGAAWALSTRPNDSDILTEWESETGQNTNSAKIRSSISYAKDGTIASWGFDTNSDDTEIRVFKLLLCEEAKASLPEIGDELEVELKGLGKTALEVTADYLRKFWEHVTQILKRRVGADVFDSIPIHVVITIPAIWDHQAQELTKQAAKMAGITDRPDLELELVSEPEAAARYVLSEDFSLSVGDTFVVCDAGGGTIDLVSFQVERLDPLRMKMCTKVTGDLAGATVLDNAFEEHIEGVLGQEIVDAIPLRTKTKMINDWEYGIKRNFKHGQPADKIWYLDIPGLSRLICRHPSYEGASLLREKSEEESEALISTSTVDEDDWEMTDTLKLKTRELNDIFGRVCPTIVGLVQEQVEEVIRSTSSKPKAILLVGGFGANTYLREELEISFAGIEIRQPKDAWSAICRGAVLKGMNDEIVTNYISRYHYGIVYREIFNPQRHRCEDKLWDELQDAWLTKAQMRWYLSQGESVRKDACVTHAWSLNIRTRDKFEKLCLDIFYCARLVAPERQNLDVFELCTLNLTFEAEVWDELPRFKNKAGVTYRKLAFDLKMKVSGSGLEWFCLYKGKSCGSLTVDMNMDPQKIAAP